MPITLVAGPPKVKGMKEASGIPRQFKMHKLHKPAPAPKSPHRKGNHTRLDLPDAYWQHQNRAPGVPSLGEMARMRAIPAEFYPGPGARRSQSRLRCNKTTVIYRNMRTPPRKGNRHRHQFTPIYGLN